MMSSVIYYSTNARKNEIYLLSISRLYVTAILFACCYVTGWGKFGRAFCKQTSVAACRFQNECNKEEIALRVGQSWFEIKLVITNRTPASRSSDFVITRYLISDQIALTSARLRAAFQLSVLTNKITKAC